MIMISIHLCPTENVINVTLLSISQQGDFVFTPLVLSSSYEIFGLSAVLESVGGTAGALWSCSIFLIGNNNEIVAITRPVRSVCVSMLCLYSIM